MIVCTCACVGTSISVSHFSGSVPKRDQNLYSHTLGLLVRGNVPRKPGEITGRLGILPLSWGSARLIAYCLSRCNLRL